MYSYYSYCQWCEPHTESKGNKKRDLKYKDKHDEMQFEVQGCKLILNNGCKHMHTNGWKQISTYGCKLINLTEQGLVKQGMQA